MKKETLVQVFSCEFYDIFKNAFFYRTLPWLLLSLNCWLRTGIWLFRKSLLNYLKQALEKENVNFSPSQMNQMVHYYSEFCFASLKGCGMFFWLWKSFYVPCFCQSLFYGVEMCHIKDYYHTHIFLTPPPPFCDS